MNYQEFTGRDHFNFEELMAFAYGTLVTDPPAGFDARLPAPPFLMIDRILLIESDGKQGRMIAEQDIRLDAWYFQCHMPGDPVQPGCLGVDAIWQLLGFYCIWRGALGSGRALVAPVLPSMVRFAPSTNVSVTKSTFGVIRD